jgi:hypothetical protein
VKAMQVTGLAAGREYLRFFFDPVGTICRLYQRYGPVTALGRVKFKQPRDVCSLPSARNSTCCSIPSAKYADKSGEWLIFPQTEQVN